MSSNSNLPDLETPDHQYTHGASGPVEPIPMSTTQQQEISLQFKKELFNKPPPVDHGAVLSSIQPHPEVLEKKKEVLQDLALQKQAVQEAKGLIQGFY